MGFAGNARAIAMKFFEALQQAPLHLVIVGLVTFSVVSITSVSRFTLIKSLFR